MAGLYPMNSVPPNHAQTSPKFSLNFQFEIRFSIIKRKTEIKLKFDFCFKSKNGNLDFFSIFVSFLVKKSNEQFGSRIVEVNSFYHSFNMLLQILSIVCFGSSPVSLLFPLVFTKNKKRKVFNFQTYEKF